LQCDISLENSFSFSLETTYEVSKQHSVTLKLIKIVLMRCHDWLIFF